MNIRLKITGISKKEIERIINSCTVCIDYAQENGESESESFELMLSDAGCVEYEDLEDPDDGFIDCSDPEMIGDNPFEDIEMEDEMIFDEELINDDGFVQIGTPDLLEETNPSEEPIPMIKPDTNIDGLELSVRTYNCLRRAGVDTIEKLRSMTDDELRNVRSLSERGFNEIKEKMATFKIEQKPKNDYPAMLDELVGLEDVKRQIRKIRALARMKQDMPQDKAQVPIVLNMEFVGNPGTAKTTVARIVAGILAQVGILSFKDIVEVGRADLVAKYEGQTAEKVKSVFRRAQGRLLFIDEAYSLVENCRGEFGDEAISTIVQEMENHREDVLVIFAGYPEKMKDFLEKNEGLKSRIAFHLNFPDYPPDELTDILKLMVQQHNYKIEDEAIEKCRDIFRTVSTSSDFGNGRFVRNLLEHAEMAQSHRLASVYNGKKLSKKILQTLTAEDFDPTLAVNDESPRRKMGFAV